MANTRLINVRLSFPELWTPRAYEAGKPLKYGATFIVPKGSAAHAEIKTAIKSAIASKWPNGAPPGLKHCLRDGSEKAHLDGYGDDVVFFNATSMKRPSVIDRDHSPLTEADGRPYAGCYVTALVEFYGHRHEKSGNRVNASLAGVRFERDGDAFGGGAVATADDFGDPLEEGTEGAPVAEADDPLLS